MTLLLDQASIASSPELFDAFLNLSQEDIVFLSSTYPNFETWLKSKVLPGIAKGERTVVIEQRSGHVVGLLILKHSIEEKKLCTLRIRPEYEYRGLGVRLFNKAFEILDTAHPLLSISETALPKFSKIFDHFAFSREAAYQNLYVPRTQEFSYNGILKPSHHD